LTQKQEESDESETDEDPVETVKVPAKKTNGNIKKTAKEIKKPLEAVEDKDEDTNNTLLGNKSERKPFQRIDEAAISETLPEVLKNNSYDVFKLIIKHFSRNYGDQFGKPANDKLKNNKGRDFRKEKTKFKNKMSFGGQTLSTEVRSIRLDQDDD